MLTPARIGDLLRHSCQKALACAAVQVKNLITDRNANLGRIAVAKHPVRQVLNWKIRGGIIGTGNPTLQSHPNASISSIGSVKEQDPKLMKNSARTVRNCSSLQQNAPHVIWRGFTRRTLGFSSSRITFASAPSPPKCSRAAAQQRLRKPCITPFGLSGS